MPPNKGIGKITSNPFTRDGKVLISKIATTADLKADILKAVDLIGGFNKIIIAGDQVLLKPNYNSAGEKAKKRGCSRGGEDTRFPCSKSHTP